MKKIAVIPIVLSLLSCSTLMDNNSIPTDMNTVKPFTLPPEWTKTFSPTFTITIAPTFTYTPSFTSTNTLTNNTNRTTHQSNRFIETSGEVPFSYIPPVGWTKITFTGEYTEWAFGNGDGRDPNTYDCVLSLHISYHPNSTAKAIADEGFEGLSNVRFYIDAGFDAYKLSYLVSSSRGNVKFTRYAIYNGTYLVTAGWYHYEGEYEEWNIVVDRSIKTIQFK
jgi:hypothetical protein